jgi:hypothetical protein
MLVGNSTPATSTFDIGRNMGANFSFSTDRLTATEVTTAPTNSNYTTFTTGFHSDTKRFAQFTIGAQSTGCIQGIGAATSAEIEGSYLGHIGANSFGIFRDGTTSLGGSSLGTGITFASGDVIVEVIDPVAKTVQIGKNGGALSAALSIAGLTTQSVSPAVSLCAVNDAVTFNGNPSGSYPGAITWDAPIGPPQFTGLQMSGLSFTAGSTNSVGTATANISSGPNSPTWSIKTSGTDSATGAACNNYGSDFSINGSTGVVTPSSSDPVQSYPGFCLQAAQSGLSNTPYSQAFTLIGQSSGGQPFEPPGCTPGNHSLVRGRPSIQTINGSPVLVADDGCLIVTYGGFASGSGYEGTTYCNPCEYNPNDSLLGLNVHWAQQVRDLGHFNGIGVGQFTINPNEAPSTCPFGFPYGQTLAQSVTTNQALLNIVNQTGMYLIISPAVCSDWNGGSIDLNFMATYWQTMAQNFGANTNVIFQEFSEPEGMSNFSCSLNGQMNDQDYLKVRQYAPNSMFLAWGDFSFGSFTTSCGTWPQLTSYATHINYSNAGSAFSSIHTEGSQVVSAFIQPANSLGQAMWSLEGPESPTNCAFQGTDTNLQGYIQTLMNNNVGWQCDDGWPNSYGAVVPFWPAD